MANSAQYRCRISPLHCYGEPLREVHGHRLWSETPDVSMATGMNELRCVYLTIFLKQICCKQHVYYMTCVDKNDEKRSTIAWMWYGINQFSLQLHVVLRNTACRPLCFILCSYQARTIWFYCTNKLYLYQLTVKWVLFYTLMEYGALVNEMLLMVSGDIESNPGPGE